MAEVVTVLPHPARRRDGSARSTATPGRPRPTATPRPIGVIRAEVMAHSDAAAVGRHPPGGHRRAAGARTAQRAAARPGRPRGRRPPTGIGEVEGEPVTAAHLRALLTALDAICPGGLQAPTGGLAAPGSARRRRRPAGHPHPPRAGTRGASRLPGPPRRRLPLPARATAPRRPRLPADRGAATLGEGPRPALPAPRLPQPGRPDRPRSRHRRTPTAGRPTATTCAACAAGTTG